MKQGIHPKYHAAKVVCGSCHAEFEVGSTQPTLHVDICSNCHPFFTGKQKLVDSAGRIERFMRKYAKKVAAPAAPKAEPAKKE